MEGRTKRLDYAQMTKLLEKALQAVRQLSAAEQDEIARAMLSLAGSKGALEVVGPAHVPAILEGLSQARRGEFAGLAEVEAAFRQFDK